ncbi:hypothetical protein OAL10_11870 [Gammaproteobacteria bacterium]|nr:hypothetical protein [Gammaproteobacteria bacterium]
MKSRISKSKTEKTATTVLKAAKAARAKVALLKKTMTKAAPEGCAPERYDAGLLGADNSARLALVELKLPLVAAAPKEDIQATYHSIRAMEAAQKMGRSRQKRRTGQEVCHHLKMMLSSDLPPRVAVSRKQVAGLEPQFRLGF